ncbi:MAG: hypothetical protein JW891_10530 [Candidatus Lokiarchaeota archaeon]|nr:hypothetical protein [Candidatus Lokiarchaeota archaeon]
MSNGDITLFERGSTHVKNKLCMLFLVITNGMLAEKLPFNDVQKNIVVIFSLKFRNFTVTLQNI